MTARPDTPADEIDMATAYSAALDELWALRRAIAYEARVVEAHTLDLAAIGKNRRRHLEAAIERMRAAARGDTGAAYAQVRRRALDTALEAAGGRNLLTRSSWEAEVVARKRETS